MESKKRVICINDLVDGLAKDDVYEVEQQLNVYGTIYYTVKDKYGVFNDFLADRFMDTKQVAIRGLDNYYGVLTPYWLVEYIYRKYNKQLYIYDTDENEESCFLLKQSSNYNDFSKFYNECYSYEKIEGRVVDAKDLILRYELLKEISREDEILIQIAKEINNEEYLKIIDIPFDVDYYISQYDDGSECVEENHRKWY